MRNTETNMLIGPEKANRIVRTNTYETRNFKLSKNETNELKGPVEGNEGPKALPVDTT